MTIYLTYFIITFLVSVVATLLVRKIALKLNIVDKPIGERKIHKKKIPLLGGVAIFSSFFISILILAIIENFFVKPQIFNEYSSAILSKHIWGIFIAGLIIMFIGILDDKYNIRPRWRVLFIILAIFIIIVSGIGIKFITNPLGGVLYLDEIKFKLFDFKGIPYRISLFSDLFTMIWVLGMTFATKILDGLDGLVSGITVISSIVIFFLSILLNQPQAAMLSIILAAAFAGFIVFNFNPASIFLGESGSIFAGFMIGVLAIIAGAKVATALLVMGIPILDLIWVVARRKFWEKKKIAHADRKHIHFRLLDIGLSQKQACLFLYLLTAIFGFTGLFLQTKGKLVALGVLSVVMITLAVVLVYSHQKNKNLKNKL